MRQTLFYPGEGGYWVVECPSLPGCVSQGKTKEEAVENIKDAIEGYIAALVQDGFPVPPENFEALQLCASIEPRLNEIECDPGFRRMMDRSAADFRAGRTVSHAEVRRRYPKSARGK